jgi:hypothetical protein
MPPLNLDDLIGMGSPIQATLNGATYDLRSPEDMDAETYIRFERLQRRIAEYQQAEMVATFEDEASVQKNATLLEQAVNQAIRLLCADIPLDRMTFVQKMRLLTFYNEEARVRMQSLEKKSVGAVTPGA